MTASVNELPSAPSPDGRRTALLYAAAVVVGLNSALYFFGVDWLSHPAVSVLGIALLVPLSLRDLRNS